MAEPMVSVAIREALAHPQYVHDAVGTSYLYSGTYFRLEYAGSKEQGRLTVVQKGLLDGEYDRNVGTVFLSPRSIATPLARQRPPLPVEPQDLEHPLVRELISIGLIMPRWSERIDLAERIGRQVPVRRGEIGTGAAGPWTHEVKMASFEVAGPNETIGTEGLGPCLGLALWDPSSHQGAVAHFDPNLSVGALSRALFAQLTPDTARLQATLIGGWSGMSERALFYLRSELDSRRVPIVRLDVLGDRVTRAFVLDTRDGSVREDEAGRTSMQSPAYPSTPAP
jgi:chemotaxis receptor (MCP) glutamine deamidase CheD